MKTAITVIIISLFLTAAPSNAQFNFLKKKVEQKIEKALENKDEEPKKKDEQKSEPTENSKKEIKDKEPSEEKSLQAYSKYDFVPGEKVIFFEDFSQDAIGDFPALWNTNGSAEVVTTSLYPGNWMKFITDQSIWTDKLLSLPENYTVEFDIVPIASNNNAMNGYVIRLLQSINTKAYDYGSVPGKAGLKYQVEYYGRSSYSTYINSPEGSGLGLSGYQDNDKKYQKINQKYHIALWMQKSRVRLYQDETKLFDLPKAFPVELAKMDRIRFEDGAALVSNIRIAVGAPDTRNKLLTEGKLITYGLYFDSGKDVLKPESYGTLKSIADVLKDNPTVRIKIIGHTDSDGTEAGNLELSKKRSLAVKNELAKTFGIDAARIESDGLGASQPIAPNDTPANKALNRRVEFIKL